MSNDPQTLDTEEVSLPIQTSTSSTTTIPSNPRFLNGIHPDTLKEYEKIIKEYLSEYPEEKIETFDDYAKLMDIKLRDKHQEWPYYAAIFPENEDVILATTADKEKKKRNNARNQKYHVIPSHILRTFNNFEANIDVPYIAGFIPTTDDNEEVYMKIKQNLSNKVIKHIHEFFNELGNVRQPIDYNLLYRMLYKYNDDNPNRIPRAGGKRKVTKKKNRNQRKSNRYQRKSKRNPRKK